MKAPVFWLPDPEYPRGPMSPFVRQPRYNDLENRIRDLEAALLRYGQHEKGCAFYSTRVCTCGLYRVCMTESEPHVDRIDVSPEPVDKSAKDNHVSEATAESCAHGVSGPDFCAQCWNAVLAQRERTRTDTDATLIVITREQFDAEALAYANKLNAENGVRTAHTLLTDRRIGYDRLPPHLKAQLHKRLGVEPVQMFKRVPAVEGEANG